MPSTLAVGLLAACGPTAGGAARGTVTEDGARATWTDALRRRWEERRADARWLRETLVLGLVAAGEADRARVPLDEREAALERPGPGRFRVHFGRVATPGDPGSFQVLRRLTIRWEASARAPAAAWEPLARPEALPAALVEELWAVQTAEALLERRRPGWREAMRRDHQVAHHPFVRREADRRIALWLVPFTTTASQVVLGGDYRVILDPTGRRVLSFASLHRGMTRIPLAPSARGAPPRPEVRNHEHGDLEGDLPTPTDLLKIAAAPALRGLAVIGPRYALLTGLTGTGIDWEGTLYRSEPFRALLEK